MRDKITRIAVGIATIGALSMLPACGEPGVAETGSDADTAAETTKATTGNDESTPTADLEEESLDGESEAEGMADEDYSTDVEVVEEANTDHTPAPESYSEEELAAAMAEDEATQPGTQGTATPVETLHSDDTKIVMQDPEDGSHLVFYCSGGAITALSSYTEYPDVATAQIAANDVEVGPESQVQGVHVEGNFVVIEQTPDAYADLTPETIESEYPDMVRV